MRPLQAHCRKGLDELTAAMNMYHDMEMTFWLEKAEEAMVEVG